MATTSVAIVGAGLMGSQIAASFALANVEVTVCVRDEAGARRRIETALATVVDLGVHSHAAATLALRRIHGADGNPRGVDLVVESLPEDLELKLEVLRPVLRHNPDATLASNTSSLSITRLGEQLDAPDRTLGMHWWNPPLLMPLVELVAAPTTSSERLVQARTVLEAMGKRVIEVEDVPGFVWNRLQFALLREAVWLVEHGVASAEQVDEVVRDGLARRMRLTGPFETMGLGGASTFEQIATNLFPHLANGDRPPPLAPLTSLRSPGERQQARSRRDRALAADLVADAEARARLR